MIALSRLANVISCSARATVVGYFEPIVALIGYVERLRIESDARRLEHAVASRIKATILVGKDTKLEGLIEFQRSARIDGTIIGYAFSTENIWCSSTAQIQGYVLGANVVIQGTVTSDIYASESISIGSTARVAGRLMAPTITVAPNAVVEGVIGHQTVDLESERERLLTEASWLNELPRQMVA